LRIQALVTGLLTLSDPEQIGSSTSTIFAFAGRQVADQCRLS